MKNQLFKSSLAALLVVFIINTSYSGVTPGNNAPKSTFDSYFENNSVHFLLSDESILNSFSLVTYNESNSYFSMKTVKDVQFIQILNIDGELEYQIPIKNSLVHLSLNDFKSGDYYVNILFESEEKYITTILTVK